MPAVAALLARSGSVGTTEELRLAGVKRRQLAAAVRDGSVIRIRPGWFAVPDAPSPIVRAVRVGGSLTCVSAAGVTGLWTPPHAGLHVSLQRGERHIRHPDTGTPGIADGVVVHWNSSVRLDVSRGILPLVDYLADLLRCQPPDVAFAVIESALRRRCLTQQQRRWLIRRVAVRHHALVESAGEKADSGTESLFRYRMLLIGVMMRSQVDVAGVGRVDFVIGDRLLVEIDSTTHHGGLAQRLRDLDRDARATALGYHCLRFDYDQVLYDWPTVEAAVMTIVERGDHLDPRGR